MALRLVPVPEKEEVMFDPYIGSIRDNLVHKSGQLGHDLWKNGFSKEGLLSWLSTEQARIDIDNQPIVFEAVDAVVSHVVNIHQKYPDRLSNTILCEGEIALDCIASLKSHPSLQDSRLSYGPVKLGAPFSIMTSWDRTTFKPLPDTDAMIHQSIVTDIRSKIGGVTSWSANDESSDLEYNVTTTMQEDDFPLLTDKVFDHQDERAGDNELDQIAKIADELLVSQSMPQENTTKKKKVFSSIGAWFGTMKQKTKSFFSRLKS